MRSLALRRALLLATLAVAFGVRLVNLGAQSFWYDETVSTYLAGLELPAMLAHTAGDIHPPLYYAVLHVWGLLAGRGQFALLFPSVVCGVLVVALTGQLARRFLGADVALLAAFLTALSPFHVWYSQELRMYTLGAALGLVAVYCAVGFVVGWGSRRRLLGYILAAALGLYTLYYFAFLLVFVNLFVVVVLLYSIWRQAPSPKSQAPSPKSPNPNHPTTNLPINRFTAWCAAQLAVLVLYLPWLPVAFRQATDPPVPPWRSLIAPGTMLVDSWAALSLGESVEPPHVWPILLLFAALYLLGIYAIVRRSAPCPLPPASCILFLVGYTFIPLGLIIAISFITPLFHPRYVYLYAPAFLILVAAGLGYLRRLGRPVLLAALLIVVAADAYSLHRFHTDTWYAADDWRGAVEHIAERWRPGDAVLINAGYTYPAFVYYYAGPLAWRGRLVNYPGQDVTNAGIVALQTGSIGGDPGGGSNRRLGWGDPASDFYATTEAETAAALETVFHRHPRLWVLRCYDTVTDPNGFIRRWLDDHGLKLDEYPWTGRSNMLVQLYRTYRAPRTRPPAMSQTLDANFGDTITLLGSDLPVQTAYPGEVVYPVLYWRLRGRPSADVRVFVQLVGPDGHIWAQNDELPLGLLYPSSRWAADEVVREPRAVPVPPDVPPGRYEVRAGAYLAGADRRLEVLDAAGQPQGDTVVVGVVEIVAPAR